ncbi:zf-HC2 domain-containing protein [Streptomyces sp. NPDC058620]|uniref:zf-HC2 domain-containing protein n=1 Tax=Streptomyces sp. NPDC058620 TaxID=3346560 RepID=UPI00365D9CCA
MTADRAEVPHVRQLLGAYVLDALAAGECVRVSRHLQHCDSCAGAYVEVAEASAILGLLDVEDLLE